jgi:quinol-cytochrome oxidoreductase complex cytochrome b subunit
MSFAHWLQVWLIGACVVSLAGYVLGITMMVIIIAIGTGVILGYTYKRSVAALLGSWEEETQKSNPISFPFFFELGALHLLGRHSTT